MRSGIMTLGDHPPHYQHPGDEPRVSPAVITVGGVFIPGEMCEPIWRVLRAELDRRRHDGGQIRPEMNLLLDALRTATQAHLSNVRTNATNGPRPRTFVDTGPESEGTRQLVSTEALAIRLGGITARHARRIAKAEGITSTARNTWQYEDVTALQARRNT
jgi:hypothetical protein